MNLILKRNLAKFSWLLILLLCLVFGPLAMENFVHFFTADAPRLWLHLFTWVAGEHHTMGPGSEEVLQHTVYMNSRVSMLIHTVAGVTAIILFALQFYTPFRKKYPDIHRTIGKVLFTIVFISMMGSMSFLIATGPQKSFDGLPFYLQLWLLALGTLFSITLGAIAISKKQIKMHQAAMIFCFTLLLSAPVLRVEWLFIGGFTHVTHQVSNFFSALIFGYLAVPSAIAATRITDFRKSTSLPADFTVFKAIDRLIMAVGILATVLVGVKYAIDIGVVTAVTLCLIIIATGTFLAYFAALIASIRAKNEIAVKEWRIHILAYFISPIVFLVFWQILCYFTSSYGAFEAASFTAPALTFATGYLLMALNRKVNRGQ